jgi:ActR/RegA family two-component response regulator
MSTDLTGKKILVVEGSLLSGTELRSALMQAGAQVNLAHSVSDAFIRLKPALPDAVVVDYALHNEAFDLCTEFQAYEIPYIHCRGPNRLQGLKARDRDAKHVVWKLAHILSRAEEDAEAVPWEDLQREVRAH